MSSGIELLRGTPRLPGVEALLEIVVGFAAVSGGLALVFSTDGSALGLPRDLLDGSGFRTYWVPGLLLASVVGGLNLVAAALTVKKSAVASAASLIAGAALLVFVMVEVLITHARSPLQLVMFAVGGAIVLLAAPSRAGATP